MQAIVSGVPCLAAHPWQPAIQDEFNEVHLVRRVRRDARRRLLEVLHSTRALDTTLAVFVGHHNCHSPRHRNAPNSLGGYLYALRDHSVPGLQRIAEPHRANFQQQIVAIRNRYMHEAGSMPTNDTDIQSLLSEMHACLALVSRL